MLALDGAGITGEEQDNPHSAVKQSQVSREAAVYRQVGQCLFIWGGIRLSGIRLSMLALYF